MRIPMPRAEGRPFLYFLQGSQEDLTPNGCFAFGVHDFGWLRVWGLGIGCCRVKGLGSPYSQRPETLT